MTNETIKHQCLCPHTKEHAHTIRTSDGRTAILCPACLADLEGRLSDPLLIRGMLKSIMTSHEFRALRIKLGLTQAELGEIMGMLPVHVSRTENRRAPTQIQEAFIRYIVEKEGLEKAGKEE